MATAVLSPIAVPGLHVPPTLGDLEISRQAYNSLPDDKDQPKVAEATLGQLKDLLLKHSVQDKFGYHLIHGHLKIAEGRVMFGKPMTTLQGCYTRPTNIAQLDATDMHGHIFALDKEAQFVAYEYRQGPPPQMNLNDNAFLIQAQKFLVERGLENLIGIQVLNTDIGKKLQEFVLSDGYGAVMLDAAGTNITDTYRVTGWSVQTGHGGITELKNNETHSPTVKGTHQVFIDGKGLPDLDEYAVIDALRKAGVIN